MERHIIPVLALALAFVPAGLAAQDSPVPEEPVIVPELPSEDEVFAPFPLRMRVGTREDGISLTWEDGPDPVDSYAIYRSEKPIDQASFPKAERIAVVPFGGSRVYLDVPQSDAPYYYAVLGQTAAGSLYEIFIPLKNVSIAPVSFSGAKPAENPPAPAPAEPEPPPVVLAEPRKDGIRITWTPVREGRNIVLYRSPSPIRSLSDLLTASWVASAPESPEGLADFPVPGIGYYYALVDDEGLRSGSPVLTEGQNVTKDPVSVPVGLYRIGLPEIPYASRSLPLPFLALTKGVESGSLDLPGVPAIPSPARLLPETEKALARILTHGTTVPSIPRKLMIFPQDLEEGSFGGEEYTLRLIVKERLSKQDWKGASDELARYLSLNRSPSVASRAHFYRGQALAFQGSYRDAFFEFLQSQDRHYAESNQWIDWILDQLPKNRTKM